MPRAVTGVGPFIAPNNHDCKPGDAKASQDATPHEPPHRSPPHSKAQKPKRWPNTKRPLTRKPYAQGPHPRTRGQLKQGGEHQAATSPPPKKAPRRGRRTRHRELPQLPTHQASTRTRRPRPRHAPTIKTKPRTRAGQDAHARSPLSSQLEARTPGVPAFKSRAIPGSERGCPPSEAHQARYLPK